MWILWRGCRSYESAIKEATALCIMRQQCQLCNSAVNHLAVLLTIMWQQHHSCDRAVNQESHCLSCDRNFNHVTVVSINQQHFWSCNSAFGHVTELSIMQQCCWSCNSAVDHATVLLIMQQICPKSYDSNVSLMTFLSIKLLDFWQHFCIWSIGLSHDQDYLSI
jgi:hypothetical protein